MGAIFSRPVNYVKQKVHQTIEDTKTAINTKIDNTKTAIYTKIDNTKTAIYTKVENTKNAICTTIGNNVNAVTTKVTNTTNAVVTRITDTRDAVVLRYTKVKQGCIDFKDGVVTRVTNTYTAVKNRYIATKEATINAYNAVKTRCINTKNAIQTKYRNTRDKTVDTYRRIRNAKLTRAQKIKYGLLLTFIMIWLLIGFIILLDLYLGDYKAAEWKVEAVQAFWCYVGTLLLNIMTGYVHYTKIGGEYAWEGMKIGSAYVWEGMKICGHHTWEATLVAGEYVMCGLQICGEYILFGTKVFLLKVYQGLTVTATHIAHAASVSAEYTAAGSKIAFEYGCYGAKEGAIYLYEGTKSLMINLAVGSYHATIHLIHVTRMCVWGLLTGSYSVSGMVMDGSTFIANKTYHGSIATANYTYIAATTAWEWSCISVAFISHWSVVGATNSWRVGSETVIYIYEGVMSGTLSTWDMLYASYFFIQKWSIIIMNYIVDTTVSVTTFIYTWGYYIIVNGSKGLYYGVNQFGLKWLYSLGQSLAKGGGVLSNVFIKFFTDLGMYLWNFVYVTSMHIYNLFYMIFSFLYSILSAIMGLVRINVDGVVYCVKLVFRGIIWVLEQFLLVYYYMLAKYNKYREWLFLGFIALISLYCTGLIRDRRQSGGGDSEDEDSESEEHDGLRDGKKSSELPPIYEEGPEVPDYQDSSEDELLFDRNEDLNLDGVVESDELSLEEETHQLKRHKKAERIAIGHEDSDALSDDSLETPTSGESDKAASVLSVKVTSDINQGSSPPQKADLEGFADDEGEISDNDLDPESLSDVEQEEPRFQSEELPEDKPLYDRVAALIQTPQTPQTPGSDTSSRVSTPGSDFFAGHILHTPGTPSSIGTPGSVGTPASDFFAGHDLQNPADLDTPASDIDPEGTSFDGLSVDTPASEAGFSVGSPPSDFFAGHHLITPAGEGDSVGTPASDFFAGHHLETPGSLGTPASGIGTPDSDFFAGHHLTTPSRRDFGTPSSDFSAGTPNSELERRGRRIFEHGLEGQSDLDSLEAVPVSDSEPESPVKPASRKSSLKKKLSHVSSVSDNSDDADCDSDPETERTLKDRVAAIKSRKKPQSQQRLSTGIDSDNIESPMSPTSPVSTGSHDDDDRSCDTDSLQNLLVNESGEEADDSLKISTTLSDDVCEDSLGEEEIDAMSTDSIHEDPARVVDNKSLKSSSSRTFDNHANLNTIFDGRSTLLAKEVSANDFDNSTGSHASAANDNVSNSYKDQQRDSLSDTGTTSSLTVSGNGNSLAASAER